MTAQKTLQKNSAARIAADPDYQKLIARIERLRAHIREKTISLNEEKRWKEYQEDRSAFGDDEDEAGELPAPRTRDQQAKEDDPILREAARVAADLARM